MALPLCFVALLRSGFAFGEDLIDSVLAYGRRVNKEFSNRAELFAIFSLSQKQFHRDKTFQLSFLFSQSCQLFLHSV